jgi:hypothetical protein
MRGIGKTVFQGDRIEDFQVEILGVLQNFGPRQAIVLARLSGGPLAETGILQGMSGSPVYLEGKLLGAVALGFPFSKEPIAGIQPIESMIADASFPPRSNAAIADTPVIANLHRLPYRFDSLVQSLSLSPSMPISPFGNSSEILTPISISGFSSSTLTTFDAGLRRLGFSPQEGVAQSASKSPQPPATKPEPGSMISVGLITGDLNMSADGTVTYVDGNRLYAFGHRFLDIGSAEMPFAHSEVITCIPNLNSSFKLSAPGPWLGTIVSDRATGIAGELARPSHTIPLTIGVHSSTTGNHDYHLQVVNDRLLTPFLTQAALFSTIDATERTIGTGTLKLQGRVEFEGNLPPLTVHDLYVSDSGLVQQVSSDAVVTLAFVLGGGFRDLRIKNITYNIDQQETKNQYRLAQAWTSAHSVRPGDSVQITALLEGSDGSQIQRSTSYQVPIGAPLGALNFTLSDANTLNFTDFAGLAQAQFQSAQSMVAAVNRYRNSDALYLRVWRQEPAFNVSGPLPGGELSDPPPSVMLVLADPSSSTYSGASVANLRGSDVAQITLPFAGFSVSGAKTVQIEVKE